MQHLITTAKSLAAQSGAQFKWTLGVQCDPTDLALCALADELASRFAAVGVDLQALWRDGDTIIARIDDTQADEEISPAAFQSVVQKLCWDRWREVVSTRLICETAISVSWVA